MSFLKGVENRFKRSYLIIFLNIINNYSYFFFFFLQTKTAVLWVKHLVKANKSFWYFSFWILIDKRYVSDAIYIFVGYCYRWIIYHSMGVLSMDQSSTEGMTWIWIVKEISQRQLFTKIKRWRLLISIAVIAIFEVQINLSQIILNILRKKL